MSDSEIMTILIMFHFGTFDNFQHYCLHFIRIHLRRDFPETVFYNRFVELESRVFFKVMFFQNLQRILNNPHCSNLIPNCIVI